MLKPESIHVAESVHVKDAHAQSEVERAWKEAVTRRPIRKIPPRPQELSLDQLGVSLKAIGLPAHRFKRIADTIVHLPSVATWYENEYDDEDVSEHETRTFLIIPLILAIGWDEKRVKIEWQHIDVALFNKPYSEKARPVAIIESKRLWHGLGDVEGEAEYCAKKWPSCKGIVVSDGIHYKLFTRPMRGHKFKFSASMNLIALTRNHPYERGITGCAAFLSNLLPRT